MNKKYLKMSRMIREDINNNINEAEYGSLKYLFDIDNQSFVIQAGKRFEEWFSSIIEDHIQDDGGQMLPSGVIPNLVEEGKKKDIDMLYDDGKGTIYYREFKSNIELDSEKLRVTADKVKEITKVLKKKYPKKNINSGVFCWGVYDIDDNLKKINGKVNLFDNNNVKVDFPKQLFDRIGFSCNKNDYIKYFRG